MKIYKTAAILAGLVVSAYVWGPSFAVSPEPAPAREPISLPEPATAPTWTIMVTSPAQLMLLKLEEVCSQADQDLDGYVSRVEFAGLHKPDSVFLAADADHDGRLSLRECEQALANS